MIYIKVEANLNCILLNELSILDIPINNSSFTAANTATNQSSANNATHSDYYNNGGSNASSAVNTVIPLSFWETDPLFSKCGILPAELVNNARSNAKFFVHWLFNSHTSFKLSFRLEYIEDFTRLNYYFSIRKFTTNEEHLTRIHRFHETNETTLNSGGGANDDADHAVDEDYDDDNEATIEESLEFANDMERRRLLQSYLIRRSNSSLNNNSAAAAHHNVTVARHEAYNNLIVTFKPFSASSHGEKYDTLNQMYIICVMLINLRSGVTFTLPFMCLDVYVDRRYYKTIKLKNNMAASLRQHSLGIMLSVGPLTFFVFLLVAGLYYGKTRRQKKKQFQLNVEDEMNKALLQSLIKQSLQLTNLKNQAYEDDENSGFSGVEEGNEDESYKEGYDFFFENNTTELDEETVSDANSSMMRRRNTNAAKQRESSCGESGRERRFSRCNLMGEDREPMSVQEEVLVHELLQGVEKQKSEEERGAERKKTQRGGGSSLGSLISTISSPKSSSTSAMNQRTSLQHLKRVAFIKKQSFPGKVPLVTKESSVTTTTTNTTTPTTPTSVSQLNVDALITDLDHFYLDGSYLKQGGNKKKCGEYLTLSAGFMLLTCCK
jgi:hypothetical protein